MSLTPLNSTGKIRTLVGMVLSARPSGVGGQPPIAIANEGVSKITVRWVSGGRVVELQRIEKPGQTDYHSEKAAYQFPDTEGQVLDDMTRACAGGGTPFRVTLELTYGTFFFEMLKQLTTREEPLSNMCRPLVPSVIRDTIRGNRRGKQASHTKAVTLKDIPARFLQNKFDLFGAWFELELVPSSPTEWRDCALPILAMDYLQLLAQSPPTPRDKRDDPPKLSGNVEIWWANIKMFLFHNTDLSRGERIANQILTLCRQMLASTPDEPSQAVLLAIILRNEIDRWLITSNAWAEPRELPEEDHGYQAAMQDFIGAITHTKVYAAPIAFLRSIKNHSETIPGPFVTPPWERFKTRPDGTVETRPDGTPVPQPGTLDSLRYAHWILTWGLGHCNEHSVVSFALLRELARDANPGTAQPFLADIVRASYANRDHAFTLFGLKVRTLYSTSISTPNNPIGKQGKEILLFELYESFRAAEERTPHDPNGTGFLVDPYLAYLEKIARGELGDLSRHASTGNDLYNSMTDDRRGAKLTSYLQIAECYPESRRERERRDQVENI